VYKRNNQVPTGNNCCHGSATIITLFSVALVTQHAMRMNRFVNLWPV